MTVHGYWPTKRDSGSAGKVHPGLEKITKAKSVESVIAKDYNKENELSAN